MASIVSFEPEALYGQNVAIHYLNIVTYRRVYYVEPIPWFQFLDIGAIPLQTQTARTAGTLLEQNEDEWAQLRWYPLDHVQVRMFLPQSQGRWIMSNIQVPLDDQIVERNPDLSMTEFHVWEGNEPWFEAMNFTDYAATACRLMAGGYRYAGENLEIKSPQTVSLIKRGEVACKHIWASGLSTVLSA